jgi:hypothetical protein
MTNNTKNTGRRIKRPVRRLIVLAAFFAVIFAASPYLGSNKEPFASRVPDFPAWLYPLYWLVFPFLIINSSSLFYDFYDGNYVVKTIAAAVYLTCLLWPMPFFALCPQKFSQLRIRDFFMWYGIFFLVVILIIFYCVYHAFSSWH